MSGSYNFNFLGGFVCNIFTNQTDRGGVICSGRVLDGTDSPIANSEVVAKGNGTVVKSTFTNAKGIYSFVLHGGAYTLTATYGDSNAVKDIYLEENVGSKITLNMSDDTYTTDNTRTIIGNRSKQDITITGIDGVSKPEFSPASCLFYPSTNIEITCATEGATIRYTLDGTDPTEDSDIYRGPIFIEDDTQIKARAWKSGLNSSAVVAENYTYDATRGVLKGDNFANPMIIRRQRGERIIDDNSAYTVETDEPWHTLDNDGYYPQYRTVWYKWTAPGSGTMTFEVDLAGWSGAVSIAAYTGDTLSTLNRLTYNYDGDPTGAASINIDVAQDYTYYVCAMTLGDPCTGTFTLRWLGDLTVSQTATSKTDVPVGYDWLEQYFPGTPVGEYESIAKSDSDHDNIPTWVGYVLGTDPTNIMSRFEACITMKDGKPVVESKVNEDRLADFGYKLVKKGKSSLDPEAEWDEADLSQHRFFRLSVEKK